MYRFLLLLLVTVCAGTLGARAQDPLFSQAFLSPIYLNPAATGAGDFDLRFSAMYRRHWWTVPSSITYSAVSVDKYMPSLKGGIGLMATHSTEGYLNRTGVYGSYAYTICSAVDHGNNVDESKWFISGALQGGIAQTRLDYSKLVFDDQINSGGIIPGSASAADKAVNSGRWYADIAAGFLFNYYLDDYNRVLLGTSAHHINRPDESLTSTSDTFRSQIPMRWSANILYTRIIPNSDWSYNLAGIFYKQDKHNAFQAGVEVMNNSYDLSLGIWYRGSVNFRNMDAVTVSCSIDLFGGRDSEARSKLKVGLAHDAPIGNNRYSYSTGSSELGFVWDVKTYDQQSGKVCKPKINCKCDCPVNQ